MSHQQALWLAVLAFLAACGCAAVQLDGFAGLLVVLGCALLFVWGWQRDTAALRASQQVQLLRDEADAFGQPAPQTTPGSHRIGPLVPHE